MQEKVSMIFGGREYSLETGKYAKFASGAVMVSCGDTMVLVTSTADQTPKDNIDYLPLQVEYREKTAAAGKIPGGFLKREGRPRDHEILSARLIDRPIRPMIPKTWNYETQVVATIYSSEPDVEADTLAAVAASASLMISDIPFNGPVSQVSVGRINGEFVINPSHKLLADSDIFMNVAGTDTSITMVEGESKEISEENFLAALDFAHQHIRQLNDLQRELFAKTHKEKREFKGLEVPEDIAALIEDTIGEEMKEYVHRITTKKERSETRTLLNDKATTSVLEKYADSEEYDETLLKLYVSECFGKLEKKFMRNMILDESKRLDGRSLTEIRQINCEVGPLPRAHGSALFTRGETQSLTTATLGTKQDEQMIDGLLPTYTSKFMLHYNFPPFCTGETGKFGGTGRREIGHGNLAERALKNQLPNTEDFPYTIRVVSDILESNGSSSMATVCAGSLALFNAGVPVKKAVAGIAMGLIKEGDKVAVLSDILGDEDFLGDMDFKVAGTADGITACQMDIKIEGLSIDIMKTALNQAREGRMHILSKMNEVIDKPNDDISPYAPRFTSIQVATDMIGTIIGPGGETIRSIVAETETEINIEDDGTVMIASVNKEQTDQAIAMIQGLIQKPEEGKIYKGKVKEIREGLGAFVEILPKKTGLLHISQLSYQHTENVSDVLEVGQEIEVKLLEISKDGKYRLSMKATQPRPEGLEEREERRDDYRRDDRRDSRGGDRRDSRGGDRRDSRGGDRRDSRGGGGRPPQRRRD